MSARSTVAVAPTFEGPSYLGTDAGALRTGLSGATRADGDTPPWWAPSNPIFWVGALLLFATGAITVSTAVNLGPLKFKGSA